MEIIRPFSSFPKAFLSLKFELLFPRKKNKAAEIAQWQNNLSIKPDRRSKSKLIGPISNQERFSKYDLLIFQIPKFALTF